MVSCFCGEKEANDGYLLLGEKVGLERGVEICVAHREN